MKRFLKWVAGLAVAVVLMGVVATLRTPQHLYRFTGTFTDCPARPSCVSSTAVDELHRIEPLSYTGDAAAARQKLEAVLAEMPNARIAEARADYLHAVFTTPRMKYRDDLELLVQPDGVIQVRSISRFGYRDFGVNRARVEALRAAFMR